MEEYKQGVRAFFKNDKFAELVGAEIVEVTDKCVVVRAKIGNEHLNGNGFVQGGMLYSVADFAFAVLANYLHPASVTQCGHINYIRPAKTGEITAIARETERAGHTCISEVIVKDDKGETVCICNFNGFVKDVDKLQWIKGV